MGSLTFFKSFKVLKFKRYGPRQRRLVRKLKACACLFLVSVLIGGGIFSYVWPRVKIVNLIYYYNNLQVKEKQLEQYNKMLKLELASIMSLEKVEKVAKEKMGMVVPEDNNVIFVKVED